LPPFFGQRSRQAYRARAAEIAEHGYSHPMVKSIPG
jgi:hypothetical protein